MSFLKNALTVSTVLVASICAISGEELTAEGLKTGINPSVAKVHGFNEPQAEPNVNAARKLLEGTPFAEALPAQKKNAKPDPKLVTKTKNDLVYFLSASAKTREYEQRNRIIAAIACLGFTKLAVGLAMRVKPVRVIQDGDTLLVSAPSASHIMKYHASVNKWGYHGDSDPKWKKNPPYVSKTTSQVFEHVRSVPTDQMETLEKAIRESYKGRLLVVEGEAATTVNFVAG